MLRAGLPTADAALGDFKHQGGEDASFLDTTVGESAFLDVSFASQQGLPSEQPVAPLQMRRRVRASFMTAIRESTLQSVLANAAQQETSSSSTAQCKADDPPASHVRKSEGLRKRALGSIVSGLQEGRLQPALCSLCSGSQGPQEEEASAAPAAAAAASASTSSVPHEEEPRQEAAAEASREEQLRRRLRRSLVAGVAEGSLARELGRASCGSGQGLAGEASAPVASSSPVAVEEPVQEAAAKASGEEDLRRRLRQSLVAGIAEGALARELVRASCGIGQEFAEQEAAPAASPRAPLVEEPVPEAAAGASREEELRRRLRQSLVAGIAEGSLARELGRSAPGSSCGSRQCSAGEEIAAPVESSIPLPVEETAPGSGREKELRQHLRESLAAGVRDGAFEKLLASRAKTSNPAERGLRRSKQRERLADPDEEGAAASAADEGPRPQEEARSSDLRHRARRTLMSGIGDKGLERALGDTAEQPPEPAQTSPATVAGEPEPVEQAQPQSRSPEQGLRVRARETLGAAVRDQSLGRPISSVQPQSGEPSGPSQPQQRARQRVREAIASSVAAGRLEPALRICQQPGGEGSDLQPGSAAASAVGAEEEPAAGEPQRVEDCVEEGEELNCESWPEEAIQHIPEEEEWRQPVSREGSWLQPQEEAADGTAWSEIADGPEDGAAVEVEVLDGALYRALVAARRDSFSSSSSVLLQRPLPASREAPQHAYARSRPRSAELQALRRQASRASSARSSSRMGPRGSRPGTQGSHRPTSASNMSSVALVPATPAQVVQPPTPDLRVHGLEEIQHAYNGLLLGDYEPPQQSMGPSSTGCSSRRGRSPPTTVQQEASAFGRSSRPSSAASHLQASTHDCASPAAGHRHASPPGSGCEASALEQPAEEAAGSARQEHAWSADKVEQDAEANPFTSEQMDETHLPEEPSHWRRGPEDEDALLSFEHLGGGPCNPEMERILNGGLFSALVAARCNSVATSTGSTPRPMLRRENFQAVADESSEGRRTPEKVAVQPGTASTLDDHFRDTDGGLEVTSPFSECSQMPAHEEDWDLQQDEAHADELLGVHAQDAGAHGAYEETTASQPFELHAPGSSEAPEAMEAERMAQTWQSSADVEDKAHAEVFPVTENMSSWDAPAQEDGPAAEVAEVHPSAERNEMDDVNALPEDHAASLNQAASHLQDLFFVLKDVMLETPSASPKGFGAHTPPEDEPAVETSWQHEAPPSRGHEQVVPRNFPTFQDVQPPAPLVQREAPPSREEWGARAPVQQQKEDAAPALAESTQRQEEPEPPLQPAEPAALPAKQHCQEAAAHTPQTAAAELTPVTSAQRQRPVEEPEQPPMQPHAGTIEEVAVPKPRNQAPAVLEQREEADVLGPADDSLQPGGPSIPAAQHAALAKAAEDLERMALFLRKADTNSTLSDEEPRAPLEARNWAPLAGSQRQPERQSLGEWPPTGQTQALQRRDQLRQRLRRDVASAIAAGQLQRALGVPPAAEERQPAAVQQERQLVAEQQTERQLARRQPSPASRSLEDAVQPASKLQRPALQRSGQKALQQPAAGSECRRRVAATLAAAISSSQLQQVLGSAQTAAAPVQGPSTLQPVQPQQRSTEAEPAQAREQQCKPQVPLEQEDPLQLQSEVQRRASGLGGQEASNATAVHAALGVAAAQLQEMANIFRQVSDGATPRAAPGISQTGVPVAEATAEEVPRRTQPAAKAGGSRPASEEQTAHGGRRLQRVKGEKPQQQAALKRPSRPDATGCPSPKSPGLFLPAAKPRSGSRLEQLRARARQTLARGVQEGLLQPSLQKSAEPGAKAKPGKEPPQSAPGGACGRARELFKAAVRGGYLQTTLEKVALQHERIDQVRRDRERYRQRADAARKAEARKKNAAIVDGGIGGPCDGTPRILKSACTGRAPMLGLDGASVGNQALAVLARAIWDGQLQPPLGSSSLAFHPDDLLCNVGRADKEPSLKLVQRDEDGFRPPLSVRSEMSRTPSEATSGGKTVRWQDEEAGRGVSIAPREAAAHSAATRMEVKRTPRRSSYGYPAEPEPPPDASHGSQASESSDLRQKARARGFPERPGKASLGESARRPASQGHLHLLLAEDNQADCRIPQSGSLRRAATHSSGSPSLLPPTRHVSFWVTKGQEVIRSTPGHGHRKEPASPWSEANDHTVPFLRRFQRSVSCSALTSPFGPKQVLPGAMPEDCSPHSRQPFVPASPAGAAVHAVRWLQPSAKEPGPVSPNAPSKSSGPCPPDGGPPW